MKRSILKKARLSMAGTAFLAAFGGLVSLGAVAITSEPAAAIAPTGSAYIPLATPTRIADTRAGSGLPNAGQTLKAGTSDVIALPTAMAGEPAGATAVVLNVTEADASAASYFTVYPTGDATTNFSNLNFVPGVSQPNLVIVPIGTGNSVSVFNFAGSADVIVDLEGYFATPPDPNSGQFFPLTPTRITDTRTNSGFPNSGKTLGSTSVLNVQVTGVGGVPATGVSAVELNVTATDTTASSFFTVYPAGPSLPVVSNLNWTAGTTIPNRVIVPVSSTGAIDIYNLAGNADAVVDVDGWFSNAATLTPGGSYFNAVTTPARITDTRAGSTQPNAGDTLSPTGTLTVQVSGKGGVPALTPAVAVTAAALNVTEATATANSFLTVYPASATRPPSSDLNFSPNEVIPNADVVGLSSAGTINIYNFAGSTDVVVDVFGYFVPVVPPVVNVVTVTPASAAIAGNGTSTDVITVLVQTPASVNVPGDIVTLSVAPASTCGTFTATAPTTVTGNVVTGTTGAGGTITATYTSSIYTQNCTFTATEETASPGTGQTGLSIVNQTPVAGYQFQLTASPNSLVHGSATTSTITAAATLAGIGVPSDTVTFAGTVSLPVGACGTLTPSTTITTGTNGQATATLGAGSVAGTCTVGAGESIGSKSSSTTVTMT